MVRSRKEITGSLLRKQRTISRRSKRPLNLTGASFIGKDYSRTDFTSEVFDGLFNSKLLGTDFRNVRLERANFERVDLACANLRGTNLSFANLRGANLYTALLKSANLAHADLSGTNLISAELNDVGLKETCFSESNFGQTSICGVDLSKAKGLDEVLHVYPSAFDSVTLRKMAAGLRTAVDSRRSEVLRFLSNAGIEEPYLVVFRSQIQNPIEYFSVFLSHSSLDKEFARKLYQDLRSLGIDLWFDEGQILPGYRLIDEIDRGIKLWDKMILVCSANSLSARTGWWVEEELTRALQKERNDRQRSGDRTSVIIPITIDDYVFKQWDSAFKSTVIERHVGDFTGWHSTKKYTESLGKLVAALGRANKSLKPTLPHNGSVGLAQYVGRRKEPAK
jgi:hypothetical protein